MSARRDGLRGWRGGDPRRTGGQAAWGGAERAGGRGVSSRAERAGGRGVSGRAERAEVLGAWRAGGPRTSGSVGQAAARGVLLVLLLAGLVGLWPARARAQAGPTGGAEAQDGAAGPAGAASSAQASGGMQAAVAAYRDARYDEALQRFAALASAEPDPGRRAVLHANAGTAAARADHLGEAVWHLRAALRCRPRDPVARRNLDLVRSRMGEGPTEASHFTTLLLRLPLELTRHESDLAASLAGCLALLLVAGWRAGLLGRTALGLAVVLLMATVAWVVVGGRIRTADEQRAVVLADVPVRAEPSEKGEILFRVAEGSEVDDAERRDDWRLIETDAGGRGWVPVAQVRAAGS